MERGTDDWMQVLSGSDRRECGSGGRPALGHYAKDRIVATDAGAILLVVLLGVADLEKLRLYNENQEKSATN